MKRRRNHGVVVMLWVIVGRVFHGDNSDISGVWGQFSVFSDQVFRIAAGRWRLGWLADLDVSSGVHGVTRPTSHGLAAMRWVIVG